MCYNKNGFFIIIFGGSITKDTDNTAYRKMLINKFQHLYPNNFSQKDAIDLLVLTVCPRKNKDKIAAELIDKFGCSLSDIIDADVNELKKIEGINIQQAEFIHMLPVIARIYSKSKKSKINHTPKYIGEYAISLTLHRTEEVFYAISLNSDGDIISEDMINKGDTLNVTVNMKALSKALLSSGARKVILIHNHPGGDVIPSREDIEVTRMLAEYIRQMDVLLIDHIIVNNNKYYKMSSQYPEIFHSDKWCQE